MNSTTRMIWTVALLLTGCRNAATPAPVEAEARLPVIDMHLHAYPSAVDAPDRFCAPVAYLPAVDPAKPLRREVEGDNRLFACERTMATVRDGEALLAETLAVMRRNRVALGVVSGSERDRWRAADPERRFLPGLAGDLLETPIETLRAEAERGELAVLAEITAQYEGVGPDDERLEPYFALAEELDLPVGIHMGLSAPGIHRFESAYTVVAGDPLRLEPVLLRHPRLRVWVMHAGWPLIEETIQVLYAYPQVYVDIAALGCFLPRPAFDATLHDLVQAGMGQRIFFGSDQMLWPEAIEAGIEAVEAADFLSPEQKRDILYENAARFLRLTEEDRSYHRALAAER